MPILVNIFINKDPYMVVIELNSSQRNNPSKGHPKSSKEQDENKNRIDHMTG